MGRFHEFQFTGAESGLDTDNTSPSLNNDTVKCMAASFIFGSPGGGKIKELGLSSNYEGLKSREGAARNGQSGF